MARCEVCRNDYDKSFIVRFGDREHVFDSFECAIHALHHGAHIVSAGSSVMAWKPERKSTVVRIALATLAPLLLRTGRRRTFVL